MKCAHWAFFLLSGFFLCCCDSTKPKTEEEYGFLGPDRECHVGEYVVLGQEITEHNLNLKEIEKYTWTQDENNPSIVLLRSGKYDSLSIIAPMESGLYRFKLTVQCDTSEYSDEIGINVLTKNNQQFVDPALEVQIRWAAQVPTGSISNVELDSIDTVMLVIPVPKIKSLEGLQACTNIEKLTLISQELSSIEPIKPLTKLKYLDISQNDIVDLTPLKDLISLVELHIFSNNCSNIAPLEQIVNLKKLYMMWNPISDLTPIHNLTSLKELLISSTADSDLTPISNLTDLQLLYVVDSNVTNIEALSRLKNLRYLNLNYNNISDVSSLIDLGDIETLHLKYNKIVDVTALEKLINIKTLTLTGNEVADILALINNSGVNKGDVIGLKNNPLNEMSINKYIPILHNRGVLVTW